MEKGDKRQARENLVNSKVSNSKIGKCLYVCLNILILFIYDFPRDLPRFVSKPVSQFVTHFSISYIGHLSRHRTGK